MKMNDVMIGSEDATCVVYCDCGNEPFVGGYKIYRCKDCGRGYRVEFNIFSYEVDEEHETYENIIEIGEWNK